MPDGFNCYPTEDGRRRCSANLPFPWRCLIEVRVAGVPTGEGFEIEIDGETQPLRDRHEDGAVSMTLKDQGHHFVSVTWRPPPDEPSLFRVTGHPFRTVDELRERHPELASVVMKYQRPEQFVLCRRFLISFPEGQGTQVFGIYTIDKDELRRDPLHGAVVKQDFLVWRPGTGEPPTYYSGRGGQGDPLHLHITQLCERFGAPHFGCERTKAGGWNCGDHWIHAHQLEDRLPAEPEFREAFDLAMEQAKQEAAAL